MGPKVFTDDFRKPPSLLFRPALLLREALAASGMGYFLLFGHSSYIMQTFINMSLHSLNPSTPHNGHKVSPCNYPPPLGQCHLKPQ